MKKQLRRYQERGKEAFGQWISSNERLATVILPTGVGKTFLAASCLKDFNGKVLWAAHREELIEQAKNELLEVIPGVNVDVEMAEQRASSNADIIVGSVQTLYRNRKNIHGFTPDLVVIDEWHHYDENNKMYNGLMERYTDAKFLGLTATPYRSSGNILPLGQKLIEMDIGVAVAHNYLVSPKPEVLKTNVSLAKVRTRAGDFAIDDLAAAVNVSDRNQLIAKRITQLVKDEKRQGILYGVDVAHAKAMADILRKEVRVAEIYGETDKDERRELMKRIRAGEIDVVCNNLVLTEGTDLPHVSFICIARPTQSKGLYCLDINTEILTINGWKKHKDISLDDIAYGYNIDTKEIKPVKILNKIVRNLNKDEYFINLKSPTLYFQITNKHDIIYRNKNGTKKYRKVPAENLLKRKSEFYVPISGFEKTNGLPLTNYELQFIGWFLSDGTLGKSFGKNSQIIITQDINQPYNKDIVNCLRGCGFKFSCKTKTRKTQFKEESTINIYAVSRGKPRLTDKHLTGWGRLEKYIDKNLSPELEGITTEQLAVLLHAIHLGDGCKQLNQTWTRRSYHIGTGNKKFAENLQSLCIRRGFKCNIANVYYNKNPFYYLHIKYTQERMVGGTLYKDRPVLNISKNIKNKKCWCIETELGTIITRNNGYVSILGNCQMMGRGLRLSEGKKDCVIVDVFDKVKTTQKRITFSDIAAATDIDGTQKRISAILTEELPAKLKNFPIFLIDSLGHWTVDNESWIVPSWILAPNHWVITWTKRESREESGEYEYIPFKFAPSKYSIEKNPIQVGHHTLGDGLMISIDDNVIFPKATVIFSDKKEEVPFCELTKKTKSFERKKLDKPIRRAFYVCLDSDKNKGRLISLIQENEKDDTFTIVGDFVGDKTTLNEMIKVAAEQDEMLSLLRADAKWRLKEISIKQKELIKKYISWGKISDDLDLNTMTGGDASAILDQINWGDLIIKLFGTDDRKKLKGYFSMLDDV